MSYTSSEWYVSWEVFTIPRGVPTLDPEWIARIETFRSVAIAQDWAARVNRAEETRNVVIVRLDTKTSMHAVPLDIPVV